MHYNLLSQIMRIMLVSKRCFLLSSNLISTLQITVSNIILILAQIGDIVFYRIQKMSYITAYRLKIFEGVLNYLNLHKINAWYIFFIMHGHLQKLCAQLLVLLLKKIKLLYILLADSNLFKLLIAIKCSESRLATLQIFFFFHYRLYRY